MFTKMSIQMGIAVVGTSLSFWLGGWDAALQFLVFFMVIDYVSGILAAIKTKSLNSEIMFWGGIRKAIILVVVAIAVQFDGMVGTGDPMFRNLAIYYYVAREGLSAIENMGILGVPLPPFIKNVLEQLQDKGNGGKL